MSAYQDLLPKFDGYRGIIINAKAKKGYSIATHAEKSGVAYSAVSRLCDGTQADPKLYNAVALCKVLGISIDDTFGLTSEQADVQEENRERLHNIEMENVHLTEENKRLSEINQLYKKRIAERKPLTYALLALCAVLACALGAYLIIDANIRDAGLIRFGSFSPAAWLFIALIVGAAAAGIWAVIHVTKGEGKEDVHTGAEKE